MVRAVCCQLFVYPASPPPRRMALLRAASYGKAFDPDIDAGPVVDAARELRVLNALRQFAVGMPLTAGACCGMVTGA